MAKKNEPTPLERFQAGQVAEWDAFVCGPAPIDIGTARAFNPGDAVPASHVARGVVREDQVIPRAEYEYPAEDGWTAAPDPTASLPGASDMPSPEDVEAAAKANREAGVTE